MTKATVSFRGITFEIDDWTAHLSHIKAEAIREAADKFGDEEWETVFQPGLTDVELVQGLTRWFYTEADRIERL